MEWLRIQLQILRERGMKAILIGHVPPARTDNKQSWDETCWQKYALWQRQYRDVIVASLYGHMNIDHFQLQDFNDIRPSTEKGKMKGALKQKISLDPSGDVSVMSPSDFLMDLRNEWANLPSPKKKGSAKAEEEEGEESIFEKIEDFFAQKKGKKGNKKFLDEIGGPWGERFGFSLIGPSIVPNYFPTLRVFDYNITGLDNPGALQHPRHLPGERLQEIFERELEDADQDKDGDYEEAVKRKNKKYKFTVPNPPSKSSPPGPAYSPQTLSLLGYTQYFANLTRLNNDFHKSPCYLAAISHASDGNTTINPTSLLYADYTEGDDSDFGDGFGAQRWREGKHRGKKPAHPTPHPLPFEFEVFYQTNNKSDPFKLKDLTVRSYINLARRIGNFNEKGGGDGKKHKKHKKHKKDKKDRKTKEFGGIEDSNRGATDLEDVMNELVGSNVEEKDRELSGFEEDLDDDYYEDYETDDDDRDDGDDELDAAKKKKKKKKKKNRNKHRKKGPKHHVWYTFIERAFVGTMSRDEIDERFGWIPELAEADAAYESQPPPVVADVEDVGFGDDEL